MWKRKDSLEHYTSPVKSFKKHACYGLPWAQSFGPPNLQHNGSTFKSNTVSNMWRILEVLDYVMIIEIWNISYRLYYFFFQFTVVSFGIHPLWVKKTWMALMTMTLGAERGYNQRHLKNSLAEAEREKYLAAPSTYFRNEWGVDRTFVAFKRVVVASILILSRRI